MKNIFAQRQGSFITVTVKEEGKSDISFFCRDIRGALVWPTAHSPGYYCIFAQKDDTNPQGKSPLFLAAEAEAELPKDLFKKMVEDRKKLTCAHFYVDLKKENQDFMDLFGDYCRYNRFLGIEFTKAPIIGKFHIGTALIREWAKDGALEISEGSILRNQLKEIGRGDLELNPEEKYFAVHALTFIVASIEKDPWQAPSVFQGQQSPRADPRGWV